jgi:glycyl-tRNA synthetase
LSRHQEFSGKNFQYTDETDPKNKFTPWVIETSVGCDRFVLAALCDAYRANDERVVMQFHPRLAPYKAAIFPLMKKDDLAEPARKLFKDLQSDYKVDYDHAGSIGKRYRRHEEIGTPYCITVDYDTLTNQSVTIRHRDRMTQDRVDISKVRQYIEDGFKNWS